MEDALIAEISRKEKERLRLQAKQKKEELEKLRASANTMAEAGEVRLQVFGILFDGVVGF